MTYIGMLIDAEVQHDFRELGVGGAVEHLFLAHMIVRAENHKTWPGIKIADNLFCEVVS